MRWQWLGLCLVMTCSSKAPTSPVEHKTTQPQLAAEATGPATVVDQRGHSVVLAQPAQRIVSLSPELS